MNGITAPAAYSETSGVDNREEMLATLHLAYRYALDTQGATALIGDDRLSRDEQIMLGRRLAMYWKIKE